MLTIIMGHVLLCMPFAVAILTSAFQSLDKSLEEAALDLGETRAGTFRLIILPLVSPVVTGLGFDPVWFTVLFAVCLQTSFLTPPVGFAIFYLKGVAQKIRDDGYFLKRKKVVP